jgi:hypothetical protein
MVARNDDDIRRIIGKDVSTFLQELGECGEAALMGTISKIATDNRDGWLTVVAYEDTQHLQRALEDALGRFEVRLGTEHVLVVIECLSWRYVAEMGIGEMQYPGHGVPSDLSSMQQTTAI